MESAKAPAGSMHHTERQVRVLQEESGVLGTSSQRGRDRNKSLKDNSNQKLPSADKHHCIATVPWDGKPGCEVHEEPSVDDGTSESSTEKGKQMVLGTGSEEGFPGSEGLPGVHGDTVTSRSEQTDGHSSGCLHERSGSCATLNTARWHQQASVLRFKTRF